MDKLLKSISAFLIVLSAFLFSLKLNQPAPVEKVYGASQPLGEIIKVASSTATYYGSSFGGGNATAPGTTTLLTLSQNQRFANVALQITDFATTTPGSATVYIQPQISFDASTWSDWQVPVRSTSGTLLTSLTLGNASSTFLIWTPTTSGTTSIVFNFERMPGKYARFNVWSTGTSTVLLTGFQQD